MSQLSVDSSHHVITDIGAYHADKKDNQCLQDITLRLKSRLNQEGLIWHNLLADTGFSDGEILDMIALLTLNLYTNLLNHVADTEIDFPVAPELS